MNEIYLFNLVKKWLQVKQDYNDQPDPHTLVEIAYWEGRIEALVKQIERERFLKEHPQL